jgi:Rps23 Pro-64 3,4-dihydroxylase Tpa1-like proline 4-hydroxylase
MDKFNQIDNYLAAEPLAKLQEFFQTNVLWTYGWQSEKNLAPFSHWNHDFLKTKNTNQENQERLLLENETLSPLSDIWLKLKSDHLKDHALVRCYANAHTFGIEGYPHTDSRKPGNYTTIVYVNPMWRPEWAGETVFINDLGDIVHAVLPKPGRITTFDGRILHVARGLSRICPAMRVTLMFKTTAPGAENDSTQA